jgi:hypothetical protein
MENRHTLLFITHGIQEYNGGDIYNYNDGIYINITTGEYLVIWNGQKKGREDKLVKDRNNIHIWFRENKKLKFSYLGKVNNKLILQHRNNDNLLQIQFKLDTINCPIPTGTLASDLGKGTSYRRYKKDCFIKLGLTPVNNYYASGIKEGITNLD